VPPPEVTALADQVKAHLARGGFAGLGGVELGPAGSLPDAELAARIVLAEVDHRSHLERPDDRVSRARWAHVAGQLRQLLRSAGPAR
jgi:hypothetical protein